MNDTGTWYNTGMLVDDVTITIKAGDGGDGSASLRRNAQTAKGGPDGGNGGNGGNIYIKGSTNIRDLKQFQFKKRIQAADGGDGLYKNLYGRNAEDTTILVPLGTIITDSSWNRTFEITDTERQLLMARGGKGGRGNNEFKSATNQTPRYAEKGGKGEEKELHLELKLIADIGLIGLPNAGKSSLLAVLTNATPRIGDYPFTTLEPNLGMFGEITLADIPGLIEGASEGRGLGIKFLKHIEKTKMLIHCIDATDENPKETYKTVRKEFEEYNKTLLEKPELILFTKSDLVDKKELTKKMKLFKNHDVLSCSVYDDLSLIALKNNITKMISPVKEEESTNKE